jgi:DNA-binding MarR family transcriptional regulator
LTDTVNGPPPRRDLLASLLPIARALRRIEEAAAARDGVTMWQYAILSVVAERPELNQREVAEVLQYSPNRIVGDLQALAESGLVLRRPGRDRRANHLEITEAGDAVRQRVQAEIHNREDDLLVGLDAELRTAFDAAARHLAAMVRSPDFPH